MRARNNNPSLNQPNAPKPTLLRIVNYLGLSRGILLYLLCMVIQHEAGIGFL